MDAEKPVLYDNHDSLAVVTLNRPRRLNAINGALLRELLASLDRAGRHDAVVAVVLTGAGRAFCAGEDLKETAAGKSRVQWAAETEMLQQVQRSVMEMGKPLIAAVRGYAVGGGCEFAMSCDIRIAAEDAVFGFPETKLGMTLTTAGTKLLSQLVGLGKAKEMVLTGDFIDADEAQRIGLVNRVVPGASLMEEAMAMAGRIADRSPLALRLSRAAIDEGLHSSFEEALALEADHLMECVERTEYMGLVRERLDEMRGAGR